jgi:hypothetical protein
MIVSVKASPTQPPLFETREATWLDVRDDQGHLVFFIIFMPGGQAFLTCSKADADFASTAENFKIPLVSPVSESK